MKTPPSLSCATCTHVRNQYGGHYQPSDEAFCTKVPDLVTGFSAQCSALRTVGMPTYRCGLEGALHSAQGSA